MSAPTTGLGKTLCGASRTIAPMAKAKTFYLCSSCGATTPKWQGQCPACGAWNTLSEQHQPATTGAVRGASAVGYAGEAPQLLQEVTEGAEERWPTGLGELDRVLGGGVVA
ncbi:MAG: hypothetical protein AAFX85_10760, partial [Pseudomonadota bacterium]